jgi:Glycosyltransferase family 87
LSGHERPSIGPPTGTLSLRPATTPWSDPHVALTLSAVSILLVELAARPLHHASSALGIIAWGLQGLFALAGLIVAWRRQEQLRLIPLLVLALVFQLGWIAADLATSTLLPGDMGLYRDDGNTLLAGSYPSSEYPPGAVALFGAEVWLGNGTVRLSNPVLMVGFQLAAVTALWLLRTRWSAWFATLVALWPLNEPWWHFRFDLVPTALLAAGLLLALRERWLLSGAALAVGTAVKWTPALGWLVLVVWLLATRRTRSAAAMLSSFAVVLVLVHAPFLAWAPEGVLESYERQAGRGITNESSWYLPLRGLGIAHPAEFIGFPADVPGWANGAAVTAQALILILLLTAAAARSRTLSQAVALAALAPVAFLLTNRVFSPQFLVLMFVAWGVAGALAVRSRRQQLAVALVGMAACMSNLLVYPAQIERWEPASATLFAVAFTLTGWLVALALLRVPELDSAAGKGAASPTGGLALGQRIVQHVGGAEPTPR